MKSRGAEAPQTPEGASRGPVCPMNLDGATGFYFAHPRTILRHHCPPVCVPSRSLPLSRLSTRIFSPSPAASARSSPKVCTAGARVEGRRNKGRGPASRLLSFVALTSYPPVLLCRTPWNPKVSCMKLSLHVPCTSSAVRAALIVPPCSTHPHGASLAARRRTDNTTSRV